MLLFSLLCVCFVVFTLAQQPPAPLTLNTTYSTSFTGLQSGKEGTKNPFTQGTTVTGWWSNQVEYIISDGTSNEGGLYSFGVTGGSARALGTVTSNAKKTVLFGTSLSPNVSINVIQVTLDAQQYRYGGDNVSGILNFDYYVSTLQEYQNGAWGVSGAVGGWISIPALSFTSLVNGTSGIPVGPLTNKTQTLSASISTNVPAENVLQLRFMARSARDGLGINNVQVSFTASPPTPTPTTTPTPTPIPTPTSSGPSPPTPAPTPTPTPIPTPTPTPTPNPTPTPTPSPVPLRTKDGSLWKYLAIGGWTLAGLVFSVASVLIVIQYRNLRRKGYTRLSEAPLPENENLPPPYPYAQE